MLATSPTLEKKIIVALSGGVDSAVTAYLLKQQGHDIEALFMKNWEDDDESGYCTAEQDARDAEAVCEKLGIKFHKVNFAAEYWEQVFENFLTEYQAGHTPNPDILCNREIKFKVLLDYALQLGASHIATGHYARIRQHEDQYQLLKGCDDTKDQSYFLYALNQYQLSKSLFPLGEMTKINVRKLAKQAGFDNHNKKDSTGICFIGERKFREFLQRYLKPQPGLIVNTENEILGEHVGLMYFTIGQREGLGIGGHKKYPNATWYVVKKDLSANKLIVANGANHPALFTDSLVCKNIHWIGEQPNHTATQIFTAKTRYRQHDVNCRIEVNEDDQLTVHFEQPQRAITPGQSIVFYQQERCLGGGIII